MNALRSATAVQAPTSRRCRGSLVACRAEAPRQASADPSAAVAGRRAALAGAVAVLGATALPRRALANEMPAPGDKAPDFKLPTNDDAGTIALSDYKGKWVVLYWYPADMTSGCTIEARAFQRDAAEYKKRNAVVLGASLDSVDSHREFCEIQGLRFPLLADEDGSVADLYGSLRQFGSVKFSDRHTFLIGPDGVVRKNWKSVNPNVHSKEVLDAIDALST